MGIALRIQDTTDLLSRARCEQFRRVKSGRQRLRTAPAGCLPWGATGGAHPEPGTGESSRLGAWNPAA